MSTPLTAGAVALLRQYLRVKRHIASPSAALLKATLLIGATRLPGTGSAGAVADNEQGFGRVNIDGVVVPPAPAKLTFADITPGLATGQLHQITIKVKSNTVPLRIVLAYSDFPGPQLINNLNLIIRGPNGATFTGNQTADAAPTLDVRNNVEVVHITTPLPGTYTVQVIGANVPQGPQTFALVVCGAM